MESDRQEFNKLLEQYVLKVAEVHIDEVDAEMQARLIKLILSLNDDLPEISGERVNSFSTKGIWTNKI